MIIDFSDIKTSGDIHKLLKEKLGFPDFYGMNWDAFWDAITGLVKLPDVLHIRGLNELEENLPEDACTFEKLMLSYTEQYPMLNNAIYFEGMPIAEYLNHRGNKMTTNFEKNKDFNRARSYVIQSGSFETGTPEQQMGFRQLFGEEVQYRFELYFHWYNLIHELGHIMVSQSNLKLTDIQEEMFVNEFAVSYYRYVGENPRLYDLQRILQEIIDQMPAPMPAGESFLEYYTRIWNTAELMQVMIYGYFQLNSVLEAIKKQRSLEDIAGDLEVRMNHAPTKTYKEEISSNAAEKVLQTAIANLRQLNFPVPEVRLQLMDDPSIQCARREDEKNEIELRNCRTVCR